MTNAATMGCEEVGDSMTPPRLKQAWPPPNCLRGLFSNNRSVSNDC